MPLILPLASASLAHLYVPSLFMFFAPLWLASLVFSFVVSVFPLLLGSFCAGTSVPGALSLPPLVTTASGRPSLFPALVPVHLFLISCLYPGTSLL